MNVKKLITPSILFAVVFCLTAPLDSWTGQQEKATQAKPEQKIFIPKEVKIVLEEGVESPYPRQDIYVDIFDSLFLPARENFHIVFFLKIKNSDLDFSPPAPAAPAEPAAKPEEKQETAPPAPVQDVAPASQLQASFNVFLQFNRLEEGAQPLVFREVYVPTTIQLENAADVDREDVYNFGYPLPVGQYRLALAVTSLDLQKIGTAYFDFKIPDPATFTTALESTPIFFVKNIENMEMPETKTILHKGFFNYSILKINPNLERTLTVGENLDIFFYIFGTKPNEQQQWSIEINFEVKRGEETVLRWAPQTYTTPLVSQPLPLKQTVKITDEKGERTEQRDLAPGSYTLVINMQDKISGLSGTKTVKFELK